MDNNNNFEIQKLQPKHLTVKSFHHSNIQHFRSQEHNLLDLSRNLICHVN